MKEYSKEEWSNYIDSIVKNKKIINNKDKIKNSIKTSLINNINNIKGKYGILFSGGIDSTLLVLVSKRLNKDFVCYTVGVSGSGDVDLAKHIAKDYGLNLEVKIININDVDSIIENVVRIIKNKGIPVNPVNVGVGCVVYCGMLLAKQDKINTVVTGMGADELFAGYKEFLDAKDVNEHCIYRLKGIYNDLNRDISVSNSLKIKLVTPYLNKDIIKTAMQTPAKFKIKDNVRKYILRELAMDLGLDKRYALIGKKAAQYSSGFDKAMHKLAKKHGLKNKKDYLNLVARRQQMVTKT